MDYNLIPLSCYNLTLSRPYYFYKNAQYDGYFNTCMLQKDDMTYKLTFTHVILGQPILFG